MPCVLYGYMRNAFLIMVRYSVIKDKQPREIVLLRGRGCAYGKCVFCDYHLDRCSDDSANYKLNAEVLAQVTGEFGELEVINSGSVFELDKGTLDLIKTVCRDKRINVIHFEAHYMYTNKIAELRREFSEFTLKLKLGLETFDKDLRESVLRKGIPVDDASVISRNFDEANFLFGIDGQTVESMRRDIEMGLRYFERICVNMMCGNSTDIKPNAAVTSAFVREIYPIYKDDPRVDVLICNTDFGVGA